MLELAAIVDIAAKAAKSNLRAEHVRNVLTEPALDAEGRDAVRITIVIAPDSLPRLKGDAVLDTSVDIGNRLREAGEERRPIVEYATEEELANGDHP